MSDGWGRLIVEFQNFYLKNSKILHLLPQFKQSGNYPSMKNKTASFLILWLSSFYFGFGQNQTPGSILTISPEEPSSSKSVNPVPFAATIKAEDLKMHLSILASDEMEGRETGTRGQRKAAEYLAQQFEKMGLPPIGLDGSYLQKIAFTKENWQSIELHVNNKPFKHLWQFYAFPPTNSDRPLEEAKEVVFLGYGIDDERYSDYQGVNVKGKILMVYDGEPVSEEGISQLTGTDSLSDWTTKYRKKMAAAHAHGASTLLIIIDNDIKKSIRSNRATLLNPKMQIGDGEHPESRFANNCFISTKIAKTIAGKKYGKVVRAKEAMKARGKSKSIRLKAEIELVQKKRVRQILGSNVLGFIEGTDEKLKKEVVLVTAHYDHLGKRGETIFNGADDNASGTSSVLEVAQAFAEAKQKGTGPRRSVLCLLVSGEEKGLLGSEYYTEFPVFPLENTVADLNIDMVGRTDSKHAENPFYVYVIGSDRLSTELHKINETANATYTQLELDYTFNADNDPNRFYYRSDHYNFAKKGIPAIFYFSGVHKDYHRPSDTVEKINFEKMEQIARLVFYTAWELANREKRIEVDVFGRN